MYLKILAGLSMMLYVTISGRVEIVKSTFVWLFFFFLNLTITSKDKINVTIKKCLPEQLIVNLFRY